MAALEVMTKNHNIGNDSISISSSHVHDVGSRPKGKERLFWQERHAQGKR
jgi:hypothetical protein